MNTLFKLQQKLKAPKNQYNEFGRYTYRNCEDILEALKPHLAEEMATLILWDEPVLVGTSVFIKATATLENQEGKLWTATAFARHAEEQKGMLDPQLTGSTSSYARKYALNGLFLIDDNKDADHTNNGTKVADKTPKKEQPKKPTEWLNPGTPNWDHVVKRMTEGMTLEDVKKLFLISKANEAKLNAKPA